MIAGINRLLEAAETQTAGAIKHLAAGDEVDPSCDLVWFPLTAVIRAEERDTGVLCGWVGPEGAVGFAEPSGSTRVRWVVHQEGDAVAIQRGTIHRHLMVSSAFTDAVITWLAKSSEDALRMAAFNRRADAFERVAQLFAELRLHCGLATVSLSQDQIGRLLGLQRTTVCAAMLRMRDLNVIRYRRGQVTILDVPTELAA